MCDSLHGPAVLLDEVIEILRLAQSDVQAGVGSHAANGRGVGAAFVDSDLRGQAMQIDGALQVTSCRSQISVGSKEEVHPVTTLIHSAVQIFPLASSLVPLYFGIWERNWLRCTDGYPDRRPPGPSVCTGKSNKISKGCLLCKGIMYKTVEGGIAFRILWRTHVWIG